MAKEAYRPKYEIWKGVKTRESVGDRAGCRQQSLIDFLVISDKTDFEEIVYMILSQHHYLTVQEKIFEQSSGNIYSFGGNSFWFAKIQQGPF